MKCKTPAIDFDQPITPRRKPQRASTWAPITEFQIAVTELSVAQESPPICPHAFQAVIEGSVRRAIAALNTLTSPCNPHETLKGRRNFEAKQDLLCSLYQGITVFNQLRYRWERARSSRIGLWEDYKTLDIDVEQLKAAVQVMNNFFRVVSERPAEPKEGLWEVYSGGSNIAVA